MYASGHGIRGHVEFTGYMLDSKIEQGKVFHPPTGATVGDLHRAPIGAGGVVRHHCELCNP